MSVAKDRRVTCFPPTKYAGLIKAYAKINETSESKAGVQAIKCFIDSLPADEKKRLLKEVSKNNY
jgi:hypothetical protein